MTIYGIAEIASKLGVSGNVVSQWRKRGRLPEPDAVLATGPVWLGKTIGKWLAEAQRAQNERAEAVAS